MKFAVLGLVLSALVASSAANVMFEQFIATHGKQYYSGEEYAYRLSVFEENLQRIKAHNSAGHSWTMSMNQFGDLTAEEFKQKFTGGVRPRENFLHRPAVDLSSAMNVPDTVDWREQNVVSEVKDQGQCGSCWSFSTTGAVEGAYGVKHGVTSPLSLSEQQLVDCGRPEGSMGCNGGLMDFGFQYVMDAGGLCAEDDYPYTAMDGTCHDQTCTRTAQISGFKDVASNNQVALKAAVAMQPVSVALEADSITWQFYSGGVYDYFWCGTSLDHGVLAVGYGTEQGKDYWLVKNSWGSTWGENGYIKIYRTDDTSDPGKCGIAMQASYAIAV